MAHGKAELMTGYFFVKRTDAPTLGILRLDTKGESVVVMVTKQNMLLLAKALIEHAEELEEVQ